MSAVDNLVKLQTKDDGLPSLQQRRVRGCCVVVVSICCLLARFSLFLHSGLKSGGKGQFKEATCIVCLEGKIDKSTFLKNIFNEATP